MVTAVANRMLEGSNVSYGRGEMIMSPEPSFSDVLNIRLGIRSDDRTRRLTTLAIVGTVSRVNAAR